MASRTTKTKKPAPSTKSTPSGKPAKPGKSARSPLDRLRAELLKIAEPTAPSIPVDRLVAEAKLLARAADKRLPALKKVGLDPKLVASLEERAAALSEAQSALTLQRGAQRTKAEIALEKDAVALRSQMVADGRYALRDDDDAQGVLDAIQEGEGLDDLVQDLRELSSFAAANKAALAKVGVKANENAARATKLAAGLETLVLARRDGDNAESHDARDLRDRAATHLAHAVSEIRAAGTYAFRTDESAAQKFRSAYAAHRRARARGRAKTVTNGAGGKPAKGVAGATGAAEETE